MTYTARKGDRAALRQIGVEPGKSVSRYRGALLTPGQVYKVLGVTVENERSIQRTILEIAMPESSYAFVLQSNLGKAPENPVDQSKDPIFQAQTSEEIILKFRKKEKERQQTELEEEKRLAEQQARREREEKERLALEKERRQQGESQRLTVLEEQVIDQAEVQAETNETAPPAVEEVDSLREESGTGDETKVLDGASVTLPEAWSALESAWKTMVEGPVLEAEPEPLRREFESLANQTDNEIISNQAKRLLEAIDLFKFIQSLEQKFIELQAKLGQLESDVAARQKLALSRTDIDFVGILSSSKAYDGKPGANGRPRPLLLRLRDPVSQRTMVYLNPKGPLSEQLWQLSRNQAVVGISGTRGADLLGVPQLQKVGTLEVLGAE